MSSDTKPRARANGNRKKSAGGTLIGLFAGLVIGVLVAAGVVWYIHRTPPPFTSKPPPAQQPPAGNAPLALPGKPGDPVDDKPRFDFYKILPGDGETQTTPGQSPGPLAGQKPGTPPGQKPGAAKPPESRPAEAGKDQNGKDNLKEPVFLQTGSFLNAGDADNQKARLAMTGLEAIIQQVMLQDKVWYRVRLGPFKKTEEVNALRAELVRQGIEANVVRKD